MSEYENELTPDGFVIDCDSKAEWAIKKIKAAREERDRMLLLVDEERKAMDEKEMRILKEYETDTSYLNHLLEQYMESVTCKETKTGKTYKLLSGKLRCKFGTPTYKGQDSDQFMGWLKSNRPEFVKVKETPAWGDFKKQTMAMDDGTVVDTTTGEIVPGLEWESSHDVFQVEI